MLTAHGWHDLQRSAPVSGVLLPFHHLAQLALMATGQVVADNPWPRSGISAGWIVLFALLTWRVYRKAPRRIRRRRATSR